MNEEVAKQLLKRMHALRDPKLKINKIIPSVRNIRECIEFVHQETVKIFLEAKKNKQIPIQLAAIKQTKENLELAVRAQALIMEVNSQHSWETMIPHILEAVKDHPEAKIAISMAMRETEQTFNIDAVMKNRRMDG